MPPYLSTLATLVRTTHLGIHLFTVAFTVFYINFKAIISELGS